MRTAYRTIRRKLREATGKDLRLPLDARVPSVFLGSEYGGWVVATAPLPKMPTIFSVGLGCDISFDLAAIRQLNARVFGFDPTPKSRAFLQKQTLPSAFTYIDVGLAAYDGEMVLQLPRADHDSYTNELTPGSIAADTVRCPVQRLATLAEKLNVTSIDVLKMDIEGGEYDSIPDILKTPLPVGQLLVELHYDASPPQLKRGQDLVDQIRRAGYKLFSRSPVGKELSFIRA